MENQFIKLFHNEHEMIININHILLIKYKENVTDKHSAMIETINGKIIYITKEQYINITKILNV